MTPRSFVQFSLLIVAIVSSIAAQNVPSETRSLSTFTFADGKRVSVDYGRLSGSPQSDLGTPMPPGTVWSPGAEMAASLKTEVPIQIDNVIVPPGTYSVYTTASGAEWVLILNQRAGQLANTYSPEYDFARLKMKRRTLAEPVHEFTILFAEHGPGAGAMKMRWGRTEIWINFLEQLNPSQNEDDAS